MIYEVFSKSDKLIRRLITMPMIRKIHAFALLMPVIIIGSLSFYSWSIIKVDIQIEALEKAKAVSNVLTRQIQQAIDVGVPFSKLVGVEEYFLEIKRQNPDLTYFALTNNQGDIKYHIGSYLNDNLSNIHDISMNSKFTVIKPIKLQNEIISHIIIGVDKVFAEQQIKELWYDILIILLISLLITFEIQSFWITKKISQPVRSLCNYIGEISNGNFNFSKPNNDNNICGLIIQQIKQNIDRLSSKFFKVFNQSDKKHQKRLTDKIKNYQIILANNLTDKKTEVKQYQSLELVRLVTFLFMSAEMLSRSFLPGFLGDLSSKMNIIFEIPQALKSSLPITFFLFTIAITMMWAGKYSDNVGRRKSYILGSISMIIGFILTAFIPIYEIVLVSRILTGFGYAILFMSVQGYVIDNSSAQNRSFGMATFVTAVMIAEICAPPIGGILVDKFGYMFVFVFSAFVGLCSLLVALSILNKPNYPTTINRNVSNPNSNIMNPILGLLKNPKFVITTILVAIPAKLLLSGFLITLVPLVLIHIGNSHTDIGRFTMLYGIVIVCFSRPIAFIADSKQNHYLFTSIGGIIAGTGIIICGVFLQSWMILLAIIFLGMGQAMSIAPQIAMINKITKTEITKWGESSVLGCFRLFERTGSSFGPVFVAVLLVVGGYSFSLIVLGGLSVFLALIYLLIVWFSKDRYV